MADEMIINARCDALEDPALMFTCEETEVECSAIEDEGRRSTCLEFVQECLNRYRQDADSYQLGNRTFPDLDSCLRNSVPLSKKTRSTRPEYDIYCGTAGPAKGTSGKLCRDLIDNCLDKEGPYSFPLEGKDQFRTDDRTECLLMAALIAGDKTQNNPAGKKTTRPNESFVPDGLKRFAISLSAADNFRLNISDKEESQKINLRFLYKDSPKGMNITLTYTLKKIADNRYSMEYEITDAQGHAIGKKKTIKFNTAGNRISKKLGFGVVLDEEGDFGQVKWVGIVGL